MMINLQRAHITEERKSKMSMTKKQKEKEIPILREQIKELEEDIKQVKSVISVHMIQKEINHRNVLIKKYQEHIDSLVERRRY